MTYQGKNHKNSRGEPSGVRSRKRAFVPSHSGLKDFSEALRYSSDPTAPRRVKLIIREGARINGK